MNIYRVNFSAKCPSNGKTIDYALRISSCRMILVEDILAEVERVKDSWHEDIAAILHSRFGGSQVLRATHHGVHITTIHGEG